MDVTVLLGFLSGSAATLIFKEIFSNINKRIEYKRDLFKVTYQRKLEIAEKATAFHYTYFARVLEVKKSLEILMKVMDEDSELDPEILNQSVQISTKFLSELDSQVLSINAVHLYFELEDAKNWSEQDLSNLYESGAVAVYQSNEIAEISKEMQLLDSENPKEAEEMEYYYDWIKKKIPAYSKSLNKFIASLEKTKNANYKTVQEIKRQLKIK